MIAGGDEDGAGRIKEKGPGGAGPAVGGRAAYSEKYSGTRPSVSSYGPSRPSSFSTRMEKRFTGTWVSWTKTPL